MSRPLRGLRLLLTRRRAQASALRTRLEELGAEVIEVPAIEVAPPADLGPLDTALRHAAGYDWVLFTSANAVEACRARAAELGLELRARAASVGPTTTRALGDALPGVRVELEPEADFRAEGLVRAFERIEMAGRRVLFPASDRARDLLPVALRGRSALVDVVVAYRTVVPPGLPQELAAALARGIDLAVFASPSAVEGYLLAAGEPGRSIPVAVLGPVTAEAARVAGLEVRVVASPSTADGLVDALCRHASLTAGEGLA